MVSPLALESRHARKPVRGESVQRQNVVVTITTTPDEGGFC
ncbi:hypothetical protein ACFWP3_13865 [Streptomyces sp. NPDC058525]